VINPHQPIMFTHADEVLTLWPLKVLYDGCVVGWCPELKNNLIVHPLDIVTEELNS